LRGDFDLLRAGVAGVLRAGVAGAAAAGPAIDSFDGLVLRQNVTIAAATNTLE